MINDPIRLSSTSMFKLIKKSPNATLFWREDTIRKLGYTDGANSWMIIRTSEDELYFLSIDGRPFVRNVERFIDTMKERYPDHLEWLLFHLEWLA